MQRSYLNEDKNEDGLVPGQQVDFSTLHRINSERVKRAAEPVQQEAPKRGRPAKATITD
tara:strand:+ start:418 stop:594 length:177 start_codon:yes stop_codon:yes gene_type:complete